MKQIFQNRFLLTRQFTNSVEESFFLERIRPKRLLSIDEDDGQNVICYVAYQSITREIEFVLSFRSDFGESDLNLMFWNDRIIFDSGRKVFFVSKELVLQASLELTTPLIGYFVISDAGLVILEETCMRIVDKDGRVLKSELFDLVTKSTLENDRLILQTESGDLTFNLRE